MTRSSLGEDGIWMLYVGLQGEGRISPVEKLSTPEYPEWPCPEK